MSSKEEGFVARWSRLKSGAAQTPAQEAPKPALSEEKPPELPDPDTLPEDADLKPYMAASVPDDLKKKALKRILAADSSLLAPDPFEMHSLDYNAPAFSKVVRTAIALGQSFADAPSEKPEKTTSNAADAQADTRPEASDIPTQKV